jgi:hypothetical protein
MNQDNFLDSNFLDENRLGNITTLDDICGSKRLEKITTTTVDDKKYKKLNSIYTITLPME